MTLPSLTDARLTVFHDSGAWGCVVCDQTNAILGFVVHSSPEKALRRALDILEGREPASRLRPIPRELADAVLAALRDDLNARHLVGT